MKDNPTVSNSLRTAYSVSVKPRLVAEWNMNRYFDSVVDNTPSEDSEGYDIESFPISSIVEPLRPTKGIIKARAGEAQVVDGYSDNPSARYYLSSADDKYKYWTSPYQTNSAKQFPANTVNPSVVYSQNISANKIVVVFENTWATPDQYTIQYTSNGTSWSTIATNPSVSNDGSVTLYWNGAGWSSSVPSFINPTLRTIRGLRLQVTSMKGGVLSDGTPAGGPGAFSFLNLIEISARRVVDLTDRLVSVSDNFDYAETSQVNPIGTTTSNEGQLELYNGDSVLDRDNTSGPYASILEPNVLFNLEYLYDTDNNGTYEATVQQFRMHGGPWQNQKDATVSIDVTDHSKFLKDITPLPVMYENATVQEIVWRLCDSVGMNNYSITADDLVSENIIPVFWTTGEDNLWEVFDALSKASQTAIYFDENNILQVKTRGSAFRSADSSVWTLRGEQSGDELTDIKTISQNTEYEANRVKVTYQTTKWIENVGLSPVTQKVWEPDGTQTLRASPLRYSLDPNEMRIWVPQSDVVYWPYSTIVNIDGELIRYEGKEFIYFTGPNGFTQNSVFLKSKDDLDKYNAKTRPEFRWKNYQNGKLLVTERGVYNSEAVSHDVDASGYSVRHVTGAGRATDVPGFYFDRAESVVRLKTGTQFNSGDDLLIATRGNESDTNFWYYGTQLRFEKEGTRPDQRAGICFNINSNNEDGYYVELRPTSMITAAQRVNRNELILFTRKGGVEKRFGKGTALNIAFNVMYDVDVRFAIDGSDHVVTIWVNGKTCMVQRISGGDKNAAGGKFGMFAHGQTKAAYEFLYALRRDETQPADDVSFLEKTSTGYRGYQWDREWVYKWHETRRKRKGSQRERDRWNRYFFDEFGAIVHEVREYEVKFDPAPVQYSYIYCTNDWGSTVTEYNSNPFGANFIVANTSRSNAVINGEETIRYGSINRAVNHITTVFGRTLNQAEAETITVTNDSAIRSRGAIELEITSVWIQTKSMANAVANWVKAHWASGCDEQEVEIFGNPLIQLGDVVEVDYPDKNMFSSTHRYFVTGVANSWDAGINTTLTLRRVV